MFFYFPVFIHLQDHRVDVVLFTYCASVAEFFGNRIDDARCRKFLLVGNGVVDDDERVDRAMSCSEIFCRKFITSNMFDVIVYFVGGDGFYCTIIGFIFEEFLSRKVFTLLDDACKFFTSKGYILFYTLLSDEVKFDEFSMYLGVFTAQCGKSERTIEFFIDLISYTDTGLVHNGDGSSKYFFLIEFFFIEVYFHFCANSWKHFAKVFHAMKFCLTFCCDPVWVIAILFASFAIDASGLHMPVGEWRNSN